MSRTYRARVPTKYPREREAFWSRYEALERARREQLRGAHDPNGSAGAHRPFQQEEHA